MPPTYNTPVDWVIAKLGEAAAQEFCSLFGGDNPYIPIKPRKSIDEKQVFIEANFGAMDTRQLARELGLTRRAVQIRLNRPKTKTAREQTTLTLF